MRMVLSHTAGVPQLPEAESHEEFADFERMAAAVAALCFIPVVAAQPQLLLPLMLTFLGFLLFVRSHKPALLLIPLPAAFVCAPTLVNAVRFASDGTWRQLFGSVMLPSSAHDGKPVVAILSDL